MQANDNDFCYKFMFIWSVTFDALEMGVFSKSWRGHFTSVHFIKLTYDHSRLKYQYRALTF